MKELSQVGNESEAQVPSYLSDFLKNTIDVNTPPLWLFPILIFTPTYYWRNYGNPEIGVSYKFRFKKLFGRVYMVKFVKRNYRPALKNSKYKAIVEKLLDRYLGAPRHAGSEIVTRDRPDSTLKIADLRQLEQEISRNWEREGRAWSRVDIMP